MVKIAAIQSACQPDTAVNLTRTLDQIAVLADQGAEIICLQELFIHPYFCQTEDHRFFELAESIPGPTTERLCELAAAKGVVIVAGLFESRAAGLFHNSAVVIDADGQLVGHYRKMHLPDDPHFLEKFYFAPGDLGFPSIDTRFGKIGVCICWDQWFPEAARLTALNGAEILVFPTAIGWLDEDRETFGDSQLDAWKTMMRSHAIANGLFVVTPNRVGREDHIEFWGASFICDPYGREQASAKIGEADTIIADCDLNEIATARTHWPFFRDRRIDAYQGLLKRWTDD
ncbi:MAG: carbon-nitrogen hydrolase [Planctomycetaceae bacterium]|nr:carbon-nitrogen hydrolase [Planctomycetaceae bacterium]MDG1807566.1 carbon-nitrogen hydrolase [Pirellulaceae bacterium]MDG2105853.1 carbon-nitrogen hydrolase [Pirellulaceae bacterium]